MYFLYHILFHFSHDLQYVFYNRISHDWAPHEQPSTVLQIIKSENCSWIQRSDVNTVGNHVQHEDTSYKTWESFVYVGHTMEGHKQSLYLVERANAQLHQ